VRLILWYGAGRPAERGDCGPSNNGDAGVEPACSFFLYVDKARAKCSSTEEDDIAPSSCNGCPDGMGLQR
jgi:hypothetical protein